MAPDRPTTPRPADPPEGPAPSAPEAALVHIMIDDEGNVILSDLPAEFEDLVRELTDDPDLLSRFCPVKPASDPKSPTGG
jgi:hypothetical protein